MCGGSTAVAPGAPARRPARPRPAMPRLLVVLAGPARAPGSCRVQAPGRVLRVWSLVNATSDELRAAQPSEELPTAAVARLARQLTAAQAELGRSVSPALAAELDGLLPAGCEDARTAAELQMDYASLLGWLSGVVIETLDRLELAAAAGEAGGASGPMAGRPAVRTRRTVGYSR